MPEIIAAALATDGLIFLILAVVIAGLVRGFAGFGTAMVFMPIASQFIPPVWALTAMAIFDCIGPLPNAPRAIKDGHPRDVLRLGAGLLIGAPLGIYVLSLMSPEVFRYSISFFSLLLLALLALGVRYSGTLTKPLIFGTGTLSGFLFGIAGIAAPPAIMLYMASTHPAKVIRANLMLFLILADYVMLATLYISGLLDSSAIIIGLLLIIPYTLANIAGAAMFNPNREGTYRTIAYVVIAASAITGLPIWD
jgi:uncharacterized membrane protein YfcA